ncbi:glycosyltransferase family 4 protein [Sinomonas sp. ASV322]|uniref:glycosyltransferase family 4 protein n=1 Tax=Sinomonas sp. ASV322 TaxID=3041920 RepID=UPI0027DB2044|nr:glycosyltransferase family 4 protein [Sinomonas sp. ASV322]MDQ4503284.1 glycosyltransferase family 4 protein [Sinomonas sp. ASV322]
MRILGGRIAMAAIGNAADPGLWSGTPSNLFRGLERLGADVVALDVTPPARRAIVDAVAAPWVLARIPRLGLRSAVDRSRRAALQSMAYSAACSARAKQLLSQLGPFDAVIQIGTGYRIDHPRVVSYEDMTIRQALRWPETCWGDVPRWTVTRRLRFQSERYRANAAAAFATPWAAASAVADLGCPPEKAHAVGIGANHAVARETPRRWTTPRFLFPARAWEAKGGPDVVEAFARVREAHPEAELHLAGVHPPVAEPGVVSHGNLDLRSPADRQRMADLWAMATCCVVPSRYEAAGIVYVEALHAGVPSVGTTEGGAGCVIGDGGIVVRPGRVDELTSAMLRFADPATAQAVGRLGRRRAPEFTWASVCTKLAEIIDGAP